MFYFVVNFVFSSPGDRGAVRVCHQERARGQSHSGGYRPVSEDHLIHTKGAREGLRD